MGIYDLLNKRTLKFKEENIKFISEKMKLTKAKAEEVYKEWKKYYMNTKIDENLYFIKKQETLKLGKCI